VSDLSWIWDILRTVTLYRRKGDAAARRGDDREAEQAWNTGLSASEEAFDALSITHRLEPVQAQSLDADAAAVAAELLGVRGGLLRRLGRESDALESYRDGALLEKEHDLPQTYDRTNAIKLALIVGDTTLAQLHDELTSLQKVLERRLSTDERAADDAWLWADLGDVRLLLGDVQGAASAYRDFVAKARTESPVSTLTVLKEIADVLCAHGDPDAARMTADLDKIEMLLTPRRRK
jgi:tetratricopeptide (TPR) repeat protein